ncbi:MAG: TIGR03086 family metal-binding protein [Acidimicrobiia bacterium]
MSDPIADFERAADGFAAELGRCDGGLDGQSPCEGWKAQDVVDHVLGNTTGFAGGLGAEVPETGDDLTARYSAARQALVDAARQPGALDKRVPGPLGGDMPAGMLLGIIATDTLIHTWDLARALGHDVELDADLLQRSWDGIKPMEAMIRQPGVFGPAVEVPDDAPFQTRALAFFGRRA